MILTSLTRVVKLSVLGHSAGSRVASRRPARHSSSRESCICDSLEEARGFLLLIEAWFAESHGDETSTHRAFIDVGVDEPSGPTIWEDLTGRNAMHSDDLAGLLATSYTDWFYFLSPAQLFRSGAGFESGERVYKEVISRPRKKVLRSLNPLLGAANSGSESMSLLYRIS